jgi:transposase-like protein
MDAGGYIMAYPGYDAKTKLEIIKQVWKGAKVAPLSRKFGISRDSIHRWINEVEEKTLKSLAPTTPGPKIDPILRLRQKNEELGSLVKKLQDKIEAISQLSQITVSAKAPSLLEERPSRCPECGGDRIWKNGAYRVSGERTSRSLRLKEKGVVQRFRCSECGVKLYLVKKKSKMKTYR